MSNSPAPKPVHPLARKLRLARILNVVLGAVTAFLLVVVIAQSVPNAGQAAAGGGATQTPAAGEAGAGENTAGSGAGSELAKRDPNDPLAIGDVDAPVVLVEWADFRCPFCAVVTNQTLPTIFEEYVEQGLVRYEFRDVAFFGDESVDAAVAARAAGEQGRFPEYLEAVFAAAPEKGHPDMPREKLVGFAAEAGVPDLAKFEQDLDRADLRDAVLASTAEAQKLGVTSVPFFVAGDQAIAGAQAIENFRALLDEQLAAAGE
ncbi:disulfide bond formation protein [Agromyces sp. Root1464]|uniref:DsbA family protein n=1 Tax=Agromyces sp. Root1464 TaxID=1736467 RepID=UPI0006F9DA83|nr:thioredoxin domain-containing protein [Agromyces sp. Root1464]KQZ10824.1 disulfide bond formation protein [Agromyces sp. Root1464]